MTEGIDCVVVKDLYPGLMYRRLIHMNFVSVIVVLSNTKYGYRRRTVTVMRSDGEIFTFENLRENMPWVNNSYLVT